MTGQENNYKYIAEAWLNDEKEYEFKRAFLENLIKQYQGHNNGFDADKLDGMHYADILEEISTSTTDMMTSFYVGDTHFQQQTNSGEIYYLDLRAIKLYPEESHIDMGTFINNSEYPWNYTTDYYRDKPTSRERLGGSSEENDETSKNYWPNPTLFDIIRETYYLLHTNKVSVGVFNNLRDRVTTLESNVGNMGNHQLNGKLNADTVNGLQFYVVTQEQYENDYTTSQKNDIHNVFIIKDSIPGGTYEGNPSFPSFLNDGYEFAIERMQVPSSNDPNTLEEKLCLVYRIKSDNNQQNEWKIIAPAADFIDEDYLAEIIESNSFQLSAEVMRQGYRLEVPINSLRDYEKDNANTHNDSVYALSKYVKRNYLYGARVHTLEHIPPLNSNNSGKFNVVKIEGTEDNDYKYIDTVDNVSDANGEIVKHNNYLYLNLDSTIKNIKDVVHSRFGVVDGYINDLRTSINGILSSIQTINDTQNSHATSISSLNDSIGNLNEGLSSKAGKQWSTYYLDGINVWMKQYSKNNGSSYPFNTDEARNYIKYNLDLGLAYIELHFVHRTSIHFQGNWRGITIPKSFQQGDAPITVEQGGSYSATYGNEVPIGTGMWEIYTTYELKQNSDYQEGFIGASKPFIPESVPEINYPVPLSHEPIVSEQDYETAGSPYIPKFLLPRHDVMLTPINDVNCDRNWAKVKISSSPRTLHFNPNTMDEIFNDNEALSGNYYIRHSRGEIMVWYNQNLAKSGDYRARDITIHASGLYKIKGAYDDDN